MLNSVSNTEASSYPPACRAISEDDVVRVVVSGDSRLSTLEKGHGAVADLREIPKDGRSREIDLAQLHTLDTAGALTLVNLRSGIGGESIAFVNARPEHRILLEEVARAVSTSAPAVPPPHPLVDFIQRFVICTTSILRDAVRF